MTVFFKTFKRQPHKMVKHTQTVLWGWHLKDCPVQFNFIMRELLKCFLLKNIFLFHGNTLNKENSWGWIGFIGFRKGPPTNTRWHFQFIICKSWNFVIYIFFNFGRDPCGSFPMLFPVLAVKKLWPRFYCIALLYLWAQKVCLRFSKSYFKLEILIFLSFVVSFLVYMFN